MKTIAIYNNKGGVGKTTAAKTIAEGLVIRGHNVLLIDADGQANLTTGCNIAPDSGFYDIMVRDRVNWRDAMVMVNPERYLPDGVQSKGVLALLPANKEVPTIPMNTHDGFRLLKRLHQLRETGFFHYVIIDTSPSVSMLHAMIVSSVDAVLCMTQLEEGSMQGVQNTLDLIQQANATRRGVNLPPVQLLGIQPNQVRRVVEHDENRAELTRGLQVPVLPDISLRIAWAEAMSRRQSIFAYGVDARAIDDGWRLVDVVEAYHAG